MTSKTIDAWRPLREYTTARIALGRTGVAAPTRVNLQFQLDHARARDAVHQALNLDELIVACTTELTSAGNDQRDTLFPIISLCSVAGDRNRYLQRPDLGRQLPEQQWQTLRSRAAEQGPIDVALIIADGLSSAAVVAHAVNLSRLLIDGLHALGLRLGPLCLASQARVALADDIGEALGATLSIILIGERPGLSSPDSLGLYITHSPKRGRSDAQRNCISNIREAGLSYPQAAETALYLVRGALRKSLSGTDLKDESTTINTASTGIPFLK
tara:strand:- start:23014 stop:23829 length:816 start_codon:yes stop_codon:yes gene_type:complete